jgi:Ca-activated chloride channel homolog
MFTQTIGRAWLLLSVVALAQGPYTLKLDVPVVSVDVTATDLQGALVNDLTKDDFFVYEDGVLQPIQYFSPISAPYNVFLLFDSSDSTRENRDFMENAAAKLLENLRPQDSVAVGSFDDEFKVRSRWSVDKARAAAAVRALARRRDTNETRFYDALEQTLRHEFKGVSGRRAVVVLTDGEDTEVVVGRNRDFKRALQATPEPRIPVFLVALPNASASPQNSPNVRLYLDRVRDNMQRLVDNSGGEILFSKDLDDVVRLYEKIGRQLGSSYSLGYVPSNTRKDGTFRKIAVKARNNGFRLTQSRTGYNAPRSAP